jgi:hypothetical protein
VPAHSDTHQFRVAQLLYKHDPLVQFGSSIGPHINVDHLANFGLVAWCDMASGHRFRDGGHEVSGITGAAMGTSADDLFACCKYRQRTHLEISMLIRLLKSRLASMDWGLADLSKHAQNIDEQITPSTIFMTALPHPKFNTPARMVELRGVLFMYYENPRTIGEITAGISPLNKCPQAVVVTKKINRC